MKMTFLTATLAATTLFAAPALAQMGAQTDMNNGTMQRGAMHGDKAMGDMHHGKMMGHHRHMMRHRRHHHHM